MPTKRYNVPQYMKNLKNSGKYLAKESLSSLMPTTTNTVVTAQNTFSELNRFRTNSYIKRKKALNARTVFKPVNELISNIKDDLKTGKIYNEDREYTPSGMNELMNSMTFDDDGTNSEVASTPEMSSFESFSNFATGISDNASSNAEMLAQTQMTTHAENTFLNTKFHLETMKGFNNLQEIGMSMVKFNLSKVSQFMDDTKRYQDDSLNKLDEMNDLLKEIVDEKRRYRGTGRGLNSKEHILESILGASGINIGGYLDIVKGNLKSSTPISKDMIKQLFEGFKASPISSMISFFGSEKLANSGLGKSLKGFDKSMENAFMKYLATMNNNRYKGGLKGFLGSILGIDTNKAGSPTLSNYKNAELNHDLEIKKAKAITEVIPSYLSEITKSLTGKEKHFNYNKGEFVDSKKARKQNVENYREYITFGLGDTDDNLRKNFDVLRVKFAKSKEDMMTLGIDYQIFAFALVMCPFFNPEKDNYKTAIMHGMQPLNGGATSYKMLSDSYKAMTDAEKAEAFTDRIKARVESVRRASTFANDLIDSGDSAAFNGMSGNLNQILQPKGTDYKSATKMANKASKLNISGASSDTDYLSMINSVSKENRKKILTEAEKKKEEEKKNSLSYKVATYVKSTGKKLSKPLRDRLSKICKSVSGKSGNDSAVKKAIHEAANILGDDGLAVRLINDATTIVNKAVIDDNYIHNFIQNGKTIVTKRFRSRKTKSDNSSNESSDSSDDSDEGPGASGSGMPSLPPPNKGGGGGGGSATVSPTKTTGSNKASSDDVKNIKRKLSGYSTGFESKLHANNGEIAQMVNRTNTLVPVENKKDTEERNTDIWNAVKKFLPKSILGGAIGGITSKLFKKNPILGSMAGAAASIVYEASGLHNILFGDNTKDGDKGLIGELKDTINRKIINPFKNTIKEKVSTFFRDKFNLGPAEDQKLLEEKNADKNTDKVVEKLDEVKAAVVDKSDEQQEAITSTMFGIGGLTNRYADATDFMEAVRKGDFKAAGEILNKVNESAKESRNDIKKETSEKLDTMMDGFIAKFKRGGNIGIGAGKGALISSMFGMGPIPGAIFGSILGNRKYNKNMKQDEKDAESIDEATKENEDSNKKGKKKKLDYNRHSVFLGASISSLLGMGPIPGAIVTMVLNHHNKKKAKAKLAAEEEAEKKKAENADQQNQDNKNEKDPKNLNTINPNSQKQDEKDAETAEESSKETEQEGTKDKKTINDKNTSRKKRARRKRKRRKKSAKNKDPKNLNTINPNSKKQDEETEQEQQAEETVEEKETTAASGSETKSTSNNTNTEVEVDPKDPKNFSKLKKFGLRRRNEMIGMAASSVLGMGPLPGYIAARIYDKHKYGGKASKEEVKAKKKQEESEKAKERRKKVEEDKQAKTQQSMAKQMTNNIAKGKSEKNIGLVARFLSKADTKAEQEDLIQSTTIAANIDNSGGGGGSGTGGEKKASLFDKIKDFFSDGLGGILKMALPILGMFGMKKIIEWLKNYKENANVGLGTENEQGDANFRHGVDSLIDVSSAGFFGLGNVASKSITNRIFKNIPIMKGIAGKTINQATGAAMAFQSSSNHFKTAKAYSDRYDTRSASGERLMGTHRAVQGAIRGTSALIKTTGIIATFMGRLFYSVFKNKTVSKVLGKWGPKLAQFNWKSAIQSILKKLSEKATKRGAASMASKLTRLADAVPGLNLVVIAARYTAAFIRGFNNAALDLQLDESFNEGLTWMRIINGAMYMADEFLFGLLTTTGLTQFALKMFAKLSPNKEYAEKIAASQEKAKSDYETFLQTNDLNREGFTYDMYQKSINPTFWGNIKSKIWGSNLNKYKKGGSANSKLKDKYGGYTPAQESPLSEVGNVFINNDNSVLNMVNTGTDASGAGARGVNDILTGITKSLKNGKTISGTGVDGPGVVRRLGQSLPKSKYNSDTKMDTYTSKDIKKKSFLENVVGTAKNIGSSVWGAVKSGASKVWRGIKKGASWVGGKIKGAWDWLTGAGARGEDPDYYSQDDPRWADLSFGRYNGHRDTVGDGGCGPVAAAIALQKLTGQKMSPAELSNFALQSGFKYDDGGTDPAYFNAVGKKYGVSFSSDNYLSKDSINALKGNRPVIFMGKDRTGTSPFGSGTHYVVGTGIDSRGNVNILDPQNRSNNRKFNIKDIAASAQKVISPYAGRGKSFSKYKRGGRGGNAVGNALISKMKSLEGQLTYTQGKNRTDIPGGYGDCSSVVQWVYKEVIGKDIGGNSHIQLSNAQGGSIGKVVLQKSTDPDAIASAAEPGDLLIWSDPGKAHVEMYESNGVCWGHGSSKKKGPVQHTVKGMIDSKGCGCYVCRYIAGSETINTDAMSGIDYDSSGSSSGTNKLNSFLGLFDSLGGKYNDLANLFSGILGNGTSSGGVGNDTVASDSSSPAGSRKITDFTSANITADALNSYISSKAKSGSVLIGTGQTFIDAGKKYGIDPRALLAIAAHETGWGSSNLAKTKYNMGGIGHYGKDRYNNSTGYSSVSDGIYGLASFLKDEHDPSNTKYVSHYLGAGNDTLQKIQKSYCPDGSEGGETWIKNTSSIYQSLIDATGGAGARGTDINVSKPNIGTMLANAVKKPGSSGTSISTNSDVNTVNSAMQYKQNVKKTTKTSTSSNSQQGNIISNGKITLDTSTILPLLQSMVEILTNIQSSNETIANRTTSGGNIIAMNNNGGGAQSYQPNSKQALLNSIISGI